MKTLGVYILWEVVINGNQIDMYNYLIVESESQKA